VRRLFAAIALLAVTTSTGSMVVAGRGACAGVIPGIGVRAGRLIEGDGSELVLRGINHGYAWFNQQNTAFAAIKAAGANAVRVVLANGQRWPATSREQVAAAIAACRQQRLICVLDLHDTESVGGTETGVAATLAQAVEFWTGIRDLLAEQEPYVIVNVGDEPYTDRNAARWTAETADAVRRLRAAGLRHTLMVDAPGWGQDAGFTMRDNARTVLAADPVGKLVFDIHMYGVFDSGPKVQAYLLSFVSRRIPIVIGEFSSLHTYGNPDEDAIMAYAQAYRVGYIGWSWSGNEEPIGYLNMVDGFDPARRTTWGTRFITGPDGLSTTAREASVYRDQLSLAGCERGSSPRS
jgi:mannan endo-1,4-beta-mannosidase